jgi:hypothetical protein
MVTCKFCGREVQWKESKEGKWYLANFSGKPHYPTCGETNRNNYRKASTLKNQLDRGFLRSIED